MDPISIWNLALECDVGLEIKTDQIDTMRAKMYAERREQQRAGNHDLDEFSICEMPDGESLWIVRHSALRRWRDARQEAS